MSIVWTEAARRDINAIWNFIEIRNPDAAEMVNSEILKAVEGLLQFPRRGRPGRVKSTRELLVIGSPYLIVYLYVETQIVILRILHGAQDWPSPTE
jgi:toxin ParE1/3/4